jgi:hypothetical protein
MNTGALPGWVFDQTAGLTRVMGVTRWVGLKQVWWQGRVAGAMAPATFY